LTIQLGDHGELLSDETVRALELLEEPVDQAGCCLLAVQATSGTEAPSCIRLPVQVGGQTMLLLLDSGSTHSFISANFVAHIQAATVPIPAVPVKLANGDFVQCDQMVSQLEWHCQGYKFSTDLRILQLGVYDGVLGMDWLEGQGNMNCNWKGKAISFDHLGDWITLQGILPDKVKSLEQVDVHSLNILHANN
jgi:hypothetical protein